MTIGSRPHVAQGPDEKAFEQMLRTVGVDANDLLTRRFQGGKVKPSELQLPTAPVGYCTIWCDKYTDPDLAEAAWTKYRTETINY
jgi:hypothetical protein